MCSAFISNGNTLWAGTEKGVFEIKISESDWQVAEAKLLFGIPDVSCLHLESSGLLLMGTWNKGLYRVNIKQQESPPAKMSHLPYKVINDIISDKAGNYWVCADEGVALLYRTYFAPLTLPFERSYVLSISTGEDGAIYATEGAILCSINNRIMSQGQILLQATQLNTKDIFAILKTNDALWIGTSDARVFRITANKVDTLDLSHMIPRVTHFTKDNHNHIWVCANAELVRITPKLTIKRYGKSEGILTNVQIVRVSPTKGVLAGGSGITTYLYQYDSIRDRFINISKPLVTQGQTEFLVEDILIDSKQSIWIGGSYGLWQYGEDSTRRIPLPMDTDVHAIAQGSNGSIWLGTNIGLLQYHKGEMRLFDETNGLPSKNISHRCLLTDNDKRLWVGTANGIAYAQQWHLTNQPTPKPVFLRIENDGKKVYFHADSIYHFEHSTYLHVAFATLSYPANKVRYEYRLMQKGNEPWQPVGQELFISQLKSGNYTLEIRAIQQGAFLYSQPLQLRLKVSFPIYLQWWAILTYLLILTGIVVLAARIYNIRLRKEKARLEAIVAFRTKQIKEQKEEIEARNEELHRKSALLEQQNQKIMASIRYAKRIQDAMLPSYDKLRQIFPDVFVFYCPKDVVSGDFYWCASLERLRLIAAVDCTGHGVPGAFMSLIAYDLLNEIVLADQVTNPGEILSKLHERINTVLNQNHTDNQDGMDIALCTLDIQARQLCFAGAKSPLYYFHNNEFTEIKADRKSIGGVPYTDSQQFTTHHIDLQQGKNIFYIFSDGFRDQFGGASGKKFSSKKFKAMLQELSTLPMAEQEKQIKHVFEEWKGDCFQQDDVLVMGFVIELLE